MADRPLEHNGASDSPSHSRKQLNDILSSLQEINLEGCIRDISDKQLSVGSSADLFRAWSTKHNNEVVVKRIRLFMLDDVSFAKSLGRELRLWSKLQHPNVLPLLGYFLEGPKAVPNLVSSYMKQGTLKEYIRTHRNLQWDTMKMALGTASGLQYLHSLSIIHADLKSSNILISDEFEPLISDFGLSVSLASASLFGTTEHGGKGSVRWMAKELFTQSSTKLSHTVETDIWALGMVIYEIISGDIPYASIPDAQVPTTIMEGHLPSEADFSQSANEGCSRALWRAALKCWNFDPSMRPSASNILHDFEPLRTDMRSTAQSQAVEFFISLEYMDLNGCISRLVSEPVQMSPSSDVFRAWSSKHDKVVAVKRVRLFLQDDASFAKALADDIRAWSRCNHPNILPLLGYLIEGPKEIPSLVTEWMKNGRLVDFVRLRALDAAELCHMVYGIASGLNYIHVEHKLVHKNLKGSNIFISDDGRPLIAGFDGSVSTSSSRLLGSSGYEQLEHLRWAARELLWPSSGDYETINHSTHADLWAFGMVIYEVLTNNIPYSGIPIRQIPSTISKGTLPKEPIFGGDQRGTVSRALWTIAKKCWNFEPSARPSALEALNGTKLLLCGFGEAGSPKGEKLSNPIAYAMVGHFLFKYTRRLLRQGHSKRKHKRFFWINFADRRLCWSVAPPELGRKRSQEVKYACVKEVKSTTDIASSGVHRRTILVTTTESEIKIGAPTEQEHELWLNALRQLISFEVITPSVSPGNSCRHPDDLGTDPRIRHVVV